MRFVWWASFDDPGFDRKPYLKSKTPKLSRFGFLELVFSRFLWPIFRKLSRKFLGCFLN